MKSTVSQTRILRNIRDVSEFELSRTIEMNKKRFTEEQIVLDFAAVGGGGEDRLFGTIEASEAALFYRKAKYALRGRL
jgi:hypothetical protein